MFFSKNSCYENGCKIYRNTLVGRFSFRNRSFLMWFFRPYLALMKSSSKEWRLGGNLKLSFTSFRPFVFSIFSSLIISLIFGLVKISTYENCPLWKYLPMKVPPFENRPLENCPQENYPQENCPLWKLPPCGPICSHEK